MRPDDERHRARHGELGELSMLIYRYIAREVRVLNRVPTMAQVRGRFSLSERGVHYHLRRLVAAGLLAYDIASTARTLRVRVLVQPDA